MLEVYLKNDRLCLLPAEQFSIVVEMSPCEEYQPKLRLPADRLPFFIGAGVIKSQVAIEQYAQIPELAALVIGSFSDTEWAGNDPTDTKRLTWWDKQNKTFYNAIGLRNVGRTAASEFLPEALKRVRAAGQIAILSVTALKHEAPQVVIPDLVEWALSMGADGVEINGACPNENTETLLCQDPWSTLNTLKLTRQRVGAEPYLIFKPGDLGQDVIAHYQRASLPVDAISPINGPRTMSPTLADTGKPAIEVNDGFAGMSGAAIRYVGRDNAWRWQLRPIDAPAVDRDLWSIGGVTDGYEAYHRIQVLGARMAGAAQAFYRASDPAALAKQWVLQYRESGVGVAL